MTQNLSEFFREKKQRADDEAGAIDWDGRRADWIAAIQSLYATIARALAEPIRQDSVVLTREPRSITENYLGTYTVEDLELRVGDEKVTFSPKGRNVAGAQGRVDVRGESGEGTIVLQPGPRWAIVASRYPQLRLSELNSENLGELLEAVMRR